MFSDFRSEILKFSSRVESIKKNVRYHVAHEVLDKDDLDTLAPNNWLNDKVSIFPSGLNEDKKENSKCTVYTERKKKHIL